MWPYSRSLELRLSKHNLAVNVPVTWHEVSPGLSLPMLKPSDLVGAMVNEGHFSLLCGGLPEDETQASLLQFWRHYSRQFYDHDIFKDLPPEQALRRTIPIYLHGDEGKHFKRSGIMIVTLQAVLGSGPEPYHLNKKVVSRRESVQRQALNIGGHSFLSRFLVLSIPRRFYATNHEIYLAMFGHMIADLKTLERDGFHHQGQTWFVQMLGLKGDLPFMTKTASPERHFLRAARKEDSKRATEPPGMCWLCHAGQVNIPYEDFGDGARWAHEPATPPWRSTPSFLELKHMPARPEQFLKLDLWHCFHGGVGMDFASSSLVEIMLKLLPPMNMKKKCMEVDRRLRLWVKGGNPKPHSGWCLPERISLTSYQVCPDAGWSKFDDTRVYLRFIQDLLEESEPELSDEELIRILRACKAVNEAMSILFRAGLWLTAEQARTAGLLGRHFLWEYQALAVSAFKEGRQRFPLHQKTHYLDHIWRNLVLMSKRIPYILNPLSESNQMDEDFIGAIARGAIRTSPVSASLRSLQRYTVQAKRIWSRGPRQKPRRR